MKVDVDILGPLYLHVNFRISFSNPKKKYPGTLGLQLIYRPVSQIFHFKNTDSSST